MQQHSNCTSIPLHHNYTSIPTVPVSHCTSIPTPPASHCISLPAVPTSQQHQHASRTNTPTESAIQLYQDLSSTNLPSAPTPQLHQHPSNTSMPTALASQLCQNLRRMNILLLQHPSYISIPALLLSHSIPVEIQCLTLDSLNTALHFNNYSRICMHISVGEALFLKAPLYKTSRETQGKSWWSPVIPMMSNAIVHHRSYKKTLGSCYK